MPKDKISIDDLAVMINKGFEAVDKKFEAVENKMEEMTQEIKNLERGQEDIKLRISEVAYRFELKQLEERFENRFSLLERKVGLKNQPTNDEISYNRI